MPDRSDREFRVGNDDIDAQHEHILNLAASLSQHTGDDPDRSTDVVLEHIIRFMEWHFRTEESMMEACQYPLLEEHCGEHRYCIERLSAFMAELERTRRVDIQELSSFLNGWLEQHLLGSDRLYILYMRNGNKPTPETAARS